MLFLLFPLAVEAAGQVRVHKWCHLHIAASAQEQGRLKPDPLLAGFYSCRSS